jgi:GNAT superfamily N-acetyltransferase
MPSHLDPIPLVLRAATAADQPLLDEMLWLAHTWRQDAHPPAPARIPDPICRYVDGFGRPGDLGVVAARGGSAAGAAWWRYRTAADPGYGYLADDIPELTVAVRPAHRRCGVAAAMLSWLAERAAELHLPALSLSVETDNPALCVYQRAGFVPVGGDGGAQVLKLQLADPS